MSPEELGKIAEEHPLIMESIVAYVSCFKQLLDAHNINKTPGKDFCLTIGEIRLGTSIVQIQLNLATSKTSFL